MNTIKKKRKKLKPLTQRYVKSRLTYNPETGLFVWKRRPWDYMWSGRHAGNVAGTTNRLGYIAIALEGRMLSGHRIAWLWMTGEIAPKEVDHINGNRADNRWSNLRLATASENRWNSKRTVRNSSGFKGVSWHNKGRKWMAQIAGGGRRLNLGLFKSAEEAHAAYCTAAAELHGEFARAG